MWWYTDKGKQTKWGILDVGSKVTHNQLMIKYVPKKMYLVTLDCVKTI